jgi:general secretion pathway protein D
MIIAKTRRRFSTHAILGLAAVFTAGCEYLEPLPELPQGTATVLSAEAASGDQTAAQQGSPQPLESASEPQRAVATPEVYAGEGALARPSRSSTAAAEPGDITLNFEQTDLREVIKVILDDTLGVNYTIDPEVVGTVSMQTSRPIARTDLPTVLEHILLTNGAALVESAQGYRIVPLSKAVGAAVPAEVARAGRATGPGYRTVVIPLHYMAVSEAEKVLEPLLGNGVNLIVEPARNLLIVSGTQIDVNAIRDMVEIFDVDWLKGMSVGLFPLDYAEAATVVEELNAIFSEQVASPISELVRMVPIERLNAVLLISPQVDYVHELGDWIARLDRADDRAGQRLFVYRVQNGKAADLAQVLTSIFEDQQTERPAAELAPGLTPIAIDVPPEQGPPVEAALPPTSPSATGSVALVPGSTVRIIADEVNNALVILATAREFRMVEDALRRLDVIPLQVLIEASIIEVRLTGDLEYGLEWFFKNSTSVTEGGEGRGLLDLGAPGLAALSPGFSYSIVDAADVVRGVLNALASHTQINVLSSPSLMVLDNKTASINVGDRVPIPTRQSISNIDPNAPTVNEIDYQDTGVLLEVTPRVNSGGLITMEIAQEVSDVAANQSSGIDAPVFQQRAINSTVAVQSGNTVVLGGLIRENETEARSGIPGLYRLPIIGGAFGATTQERRRTELLVLLTPRAVRSEAESRQVTEEFRSKLKGLQPRSEQK